MQVLTREVLQQSPAQLASGDQDVRRTDSASKGSKGQTRERERERREREAHDTTTKPDDKALKTSNAVSKTNEGGGTVALGPGQEGDSSGEELLGL